MFARLFERVGRCLKASPEYELSIESPVFKYNGAFYTAHAMQTEMSRILQMLREAGSTPTRMVLSRKGETVVIGS